MADDEITSKKKINGIQSVEVAGAILEALCSQSRAAPLKEIAARANMSAAKVHRYLVSLVNIGLARQDGNSGYYDLGPMATRLGISAIARNQVVGLTGELLRAICLELGASGHLAVWGENGPVLVRSEHGGVPIISSIGLGSTFPLLRSATGQVFLSYMPRETTNHILEPEQAKLNYSKTKTQAIIDQTKNAGYARISEDLVPSLCAVSWPVFGIDGNLSCSITFVSSDNAFLDEQGKVFGQISERLAAHSLS